MYPATRRGAGGADRWGDFFAELSAAMEEVPRRERKSFGWILDGTWRLMDQRASLCKQGRLSMIQGRHRALRAGHAIMASPEEDKIMAAWGHLRGWHKEVDPAASKPCYQALDRQTEEREALYRRRDPPGALIPLNARRAPRADHPSADEELR